MKPSELKFLSDACGGILKGNPGTLVKNIKIDSRECGEGDLFVCIVGEKNNGHDFIRSAFDQGCKSFLVSEDVHMEGADFICVDDTVKALQRMAEGYLNQFSVRKIAVTGSVGKTTTKMLTAAVMSSRFRTVATPKNYNSEIGLCLTAFLVDDTTEAVVFEMGMDEAGQLARKVKWVRPQVAIITNVGISHLERLGSRDAIADAKFEIVGEFTEENTLIVNAQSDYLKTHAEIRARTKNKKHYHIVSVGEDLIIEDAKSLGIDGITFKIKNVEFKLPLIGMHNAVDAALAVACGIQYGVSISTAAKVLSDVVATEKRLKIEKISGIILIDDSYNASPDSVRAGIAAIADVRARRRILILSDMLELGYEADAGHKAVGKFAANQGIDMILACGDKKDYYRQGVLEADRDARCTFLGFDTIGDLEKYIKGLLKEGDSVLVKGSNSTGISKAAEYIRSNF